MKLETKQGVYFLLILILTLGGFLITLTSIKGTTFMEAIMRTIGLIMLAIGILVYRKHFKSIK